MLQYTGSVNTDGKREHYNTISVEYTVFYPTGSITCRHKSVTNETGEQMYVNC